MAGRQTVENYMALSKVINLVDQLVHNWTSPPLVMVVEDDPNDAELLNMTLIGYGCRVLYAVGVKQGLDLIEQWKQTGAEQPQLVFLDLKLPNGDSAEIVKGVREVSKAIPIAVITGYPDSYKLMEALKEGIFSLVQKPLTTEGLNELFASHSVCSPGKQFACKVSACQKDGSGLKTGSC